MSECKIDSVWLEFELWATHDEDDDNSDVIFKLSDGTEWFATFFTYQNILSLHRKNKTTGECLNGLYFCATDMILIEKLNHETVWKVLNQMLMDNEIQTYCSMISE